MKKFFAATFANNSWRGCLLRARRLWHRHSESAVLVIQFEGKLKASSRQTFSTLASLNPLMDGTLGSEQSRVSFARQASLIALCLRLHSCLHRILVRTSKVPLMAVCRGVNSSEFATATTFDNRNRNASHINYIQSLSRFFEANFCEKRKRAEILFHRFGFRLWPTVSMRTRLNYSKWISLRAVNETDFQR